MADFPPVHPGEVLLHEFMQPLEISQNKLANTIGVPPLRINEIVCGRRDITADTALRLSRALGLSDMFWLNVQSRYNAETVRINLRQNLNQIHPINLDDIP
jgi:antitoxin HigA-1